MVSELNMNAEFDIILNCFFQSNKSIIDSALILTAVWKKFTKWILNSENSQFSHGNWDISNQLISAQNKSINK